MANMPHYCTRGVTRLSIFGLLSKNNDVKWHTKGVPKCPSWQFLTVDSVMVDK